ncbi:MAG: TetR/AcrR family transcriptional regulator [Pseudomonadota bacterium]
MVRAAPYNRVAALEAATQLFWEKGYVGTSLKDLENVLSMKPGSIYAAFKSKEDLFSMSLELYFEQNLVALRSLQESDAPLLTALGAFLLRIGENAEGDPLCRPCMVVKTLLETSSISEDLTNQSRIYLNEMVGEIKAVLDLAQERGELVADVNTSQLAHRFQANLTALRLEAHVSDQPDILRQLARDMVEELERYSAQKQTL